MSPATSLRARLVAVASLTAVASCGSGGRSDVGTTAPSGSMGPGAGGSASGAGGTSNAGGAAGTDGLGGSGGVAGIGGGGASGVAGSSATSGAVPCPPADAGPMLVCFHGGGPLPTGCGTGMSGGDLACYVPGDKGAPLSPCLDALDPALVKVLSSPCESVTDITGTPTCRLVAQWNMPMIGAAACCYSAKTQTMCVARPLLFGGSMRTARLVSASGWG